MKQPLLILVLLFIAHSAFSQFYIGDHKNVVRNGLKRYIKTEKLTNTVIVERSDTLVLQINDRGYQHAEYRYIFNQSQWCIAEQKLACKHCAEEFLKTTLETPKYEWVKINDSTYVSKFSKKRLLQVTAVDTMKRVDITKIKWTREKYEKWLAAK